MKEREQILHLWQSLKADNKQAVLATVVKTFGSSYRRPGARLLLTSSGARAGSISGGCLEEDLIRKAFWLTETGPAIRRYDTTPDGEIQSDETAAAVTSSGFGLGCNGIVHVLLERVSSVDFGVMRLLEEVSETRRPASIAHLLSPAALIGRCLIIDTVGSVSHNLEDAALAGRLLEKTAELDLNRVDTIEPGCEVFFETLAPPARLLIFGAGDDAVPLTLLARQLGWQVFVFDGRAHYARREKFPLAHAVAVRASDEPASSLNIDPWTVAVTMTHSYAQDLNNLRTLAREPLAYLGVLGPRNRTAQLLADAALHSSLLENIHSPMGLDIGADGPEQVALSVVAEIQATLNRRDGGALRARAGSIHSGPLDGSAPVPFSPSIVCA